MIGSFWWGQHHLFERVRAYNGVLVAAMFVWLLSIVFLPFPTELLQSAQHGLPSAHALYVGTLVVTSLASLAQEWAVVHWPELADTDADPFTLDGGVILAAMMIAALVIIILAPGAGLWPLLLLLSIRPIERLAARRRRSHLTTATVSPRSRAGVTASTPGHDQTDRSLCHSWSPVRV